VSCGRETRFGRHWFGCGRDAAPRVVELDDLGSARGRLGTAVQVASRANAPRVSRGVLLPSSLGFSRGQSARPVEALEWV